MAIIGKNHNGEPMFDNVSEYVQYLKQKQHQDYINRNKYQVADDIQIILNHMQTAIEMNVFSGVSKDDCEKLFKLNEKLQKELEILRTLQ